MSGILFFMDWKAFLDQLKDAAVRDLFWAVASPSPIESKSDKTLFFPLAVQDQLVKDHLIYFKLLDQNPAPFHTFLRLHLNNKRLGYLFEAMLLYFFRTSSHVEVLLANEQVFEGKKTIGEVDFIIQYQNIVYHIETSVKYYLNSFNQDDYRNWIGSSGNDDLKSKLKKVVERQIPVAHHPQIKEKLTVSYSSFLWLKGKFFVNGAFPIWKNEKAEYGNFMTYASFIKAYSGKKDVLFYVLERPSWMSDLHSPSEELNCTWEKLEDKMKEQLDNKKALHLGLKEGDTYQTIFLITQVVFDQLSRQKNKVYL